MTSIGIIGTGFGGIGTAAELVTHGYDDVRLWERADTVGGVWRDNTYPGAACDVPGPLYSFSFAPNADWSRRYPVQAEILAYLGRVADQYGVTPRTRFGARVASARWDQDAWHVGFDDGTTETVDVLISAVGQLSEPSSPDVEGWESFAGSVLHAGSWDDSVDLSGRRVAVVGTGASAVQIVPRLAEVARELVVLQRSANHILPKPDGAYPGWYRDRAQRERRPIDWVTQQFSRGLDPDSTVATVIERLASAHLRLRVRDEELRRHLTPRHQVGCKRILFSNDYYPTLTRDHVRLVPHALAEVRADAIRTADGQWHEVDAICFATGFDTQDFLHGIEVTGPGGDLHEAWSAGARAHLGIHVPGFPNLFLAYGPNTNLGGGSIITMLEAQARHIRATLDRMDHHGARRVQARAEAEQRWDDRVQHDLAHSAWASCTSWYHHPETGRITSNWPGGTHTYEAAVADVHDEEFLWT
ncbi:flavin-containing monooxygenase [Aeromicrobium duanguangcaii]|uniref:flavin-containing monooxygenase n=1 Tax=Aeromicrobium duanguangcaii TaxID=2968086 RepID=UPI002017623C|nr:NAD(P)/FAD-dependent oxidoreductase [Aeromicrobium duanguangcaii]MCL3838417.1 NAD(P)/FAD-dependent oxidoreductase [Aeromicrobium duanguangcaii]